jgi:hypothetical protein
MHEPRQEGLKLVHNCGSQRNQEALLREMVFTTRVLACQLFFHKTLSAAGSRFIIS